MTDKNEIEAVAREMEFNRLFPDFEEWATADQEYVAKSFNKRFSQNWPQNYTGLAKQAEKIIKALDAHREKQGLVTVPLNSLSNTKYQQMDSATAEDHALIDAGLKMP